jgi:hypothetical protein
VNLSAWLVDAAFFLGLPNGAPSINVSVQISSDTKTLVIYDDFVLN